VSPGALATIFGSDLTSVSGVVVANSNPLPTHLANIEVLVSGIPAPIYSIAYANQEDQISIQVPYDAPTGPQAAEITIYDGNTLTADFFTDSFTEDRVFSRIAATTPLLKLLTIPLSDPAIRRFLENRWFCMSPGWGRSPLI
jgi:hypothetical protein